MEVDLISQMSNSIDLYFASQNPSVDSSYDINFLCNLFVGLTISGDDLSTGLVTHHSPLCVTESIKSYNCYPVTGINYYDDLALSQFIGECLVKYRIDQS